MIAASVSSCIRGSVANGIPRGQDATSARASAATASRCARMRSPCSAGRISRRWCRCRSPSSSRIELAPTNGSTTDDAAPAVRTAGGAA